VGLGPPPRGEGLLFFGGGRVLCMRDIFVLNEILTGDKIYILVSTLLGLNI
jgi:hypothetical protein